MDISLNPGDPCPPEHTRAVAAAIPEAIRTLNHATISRPGDALDSPATAEAVIRDLATAAQRTPQLLDQIRGWLRGEFHAGRLEGDTAIVDACAYLEEAAGIASCLEPVLKRAASAISTLSVPAGPCPACGSEIRAERGYVPGSTGMPVTCGDDWHDEED